MKKSDEEPRDEYAFRTGTRGQHHLKLGSPEDAADLREARAALADAGDKRVSWDELKRQLKL